MKKLKEIIVFSTSNDSTLIKLLNKLLEEESNVSCLIQSSRKGKYQSLFPTIYFIDIRGEAFYSIDNDALLGISKVHYDELYVTFSGKHACNYGNVLSIVEQCSYKDGYFFNCDGERVEIVRNTRIVDFFIGIFISFANCIYRG